MIPDPEARGPRVRPMSPVSRGLATALLFVVVFAAGVTVQWMDGGFLYLGGLLVGMLLPGVVRWIWPT